MLESQVHVGDTPPEAGPPVQLLEAYVGGRAGRAGETLPVIVKWKVLGPPPENYQIFLHIDEPGGDTRAQLDVEPFFGGLPTSEWKPGEILVEQYEIPLAKGLPQNQYRLVAGMFEADTGRLIPLRGPDGEIDTAIAMDTPVWIGAGTGQRPLAPQVSLPVPFDNGITLLGYDLAADSLTPGADIPLTLYWKARARPKEAYTVFVHLVDGQGNLVAQADAPPRDGTYPTSAWNDAEYVRDPHPFQLPEDLPPGDYTVRIGLYRASDGARAQILENDKIAGDAVDLTAIRVRR
jgi:hypothetical protein